MNVIELAHRAGFVGDHLENTVFGTSHYTAISNLIKLVIERTDTAKIIDDEKDIWLVMNNTDLTEGRGCQYAQHACALKSTAIRLARGAGIQGSDAYVEPGKMYRINNLWYAPRMLTQPSDADLKREKGLEKEALLKRQKEEVMAKAKSLGLSDADIELLRK